MTEKKTKNRTKRNARSKIENSNEKSKHCATELNDDELSER